MRKQRLLPCALVLLLSACGPAAPQVDSPDASTPSELAELMKNATEKKAPFDTLPEPPYSAMCISTGRELRDCQHYQLQVLKEWPLAWSGSYQAQRNIAYMLSHPEPGVRGDATQGCTWRIVLTLSGHTEYNGALDEPNYNLECGRLSQVNWAAAKEAAKSTYKTITGKALPPIPEPQRRP